VDNAWTYKDGGSRERQEQDPTQEKMVSGRHWKLDLHDPSILR